MTGDLRRVGLAAPLPPAADLSSCDREPIHVPGAVQPQGVLLALRSGVVVQASANTAELFGCPVAALLGQGLDTVLDAATLAQVEAALLSEPLDDNPLYLLSTAVQGRGPFDLIAHRRQGLVLLEFELASGPRGADVYPRIKASLGRLNRADGVQGYCDVAAQEVQALTGFDRVMIYRFAEDGTGTVLAEACHPDLTPFLGLRYPAADIPQQARALYLLNMLRVIGDVGYAAVPLLALPQDSTPVSTQAGEPANGAAPPLDLSYSVLRSVSPVHLEYLGNMGVGASMSISIVQGQTLWGLIACHHRTPHRPSYDTRSACEFLGQVMSIQLSAKAEQEEQAYRLQLKSAQTRFVELMAEESDLIEGLVRADFNLLNFMDAPGAAICLDGEVVLLGVTPERAEVQALAEWLATQGEAEVLHTDALSSDYPAAGAYAAVASGLMAVEISRGRRDYLLWFRPEQLQTVSWGGDPSKVLSAGEDGTLRLSPRRSFAAWQETVRGRGARWSAAEVRAAQELRQSIIAVVLRRSEQVGRLNEELARSNTELDSFAYIASHDLKEPLRGLHNYSTFLMESYADRIDEDGVAKLRTLVRLTVRMEDLIDSLLLYSRVGRIDLNMQDADVGEVARDALDMLRPRLEQDQVELRWPRPLPSLPHDRVRLLEVYSNLIANAVKYNDKAERVIEIGVLGPDERGELSVPEGVPPHAQLLYVRDNGIGIREKHLETVFRIFKRLHARDQYGGGTGAGLTIARKIVERHGGQLWVSSEPGVGSTFYFTLEA